MSKQAVKCSNGHFYDGNKFTSCPFCEMVASGMREPTVETFVENGSNQGGMFAGGGQSNIQMEPVHETGFKKVQSQDTRDMQKTVSFYSEMGAEEKDLAVGVLICVKGPDFGDTYLLKAGKNFIGRDPSMDVVVAHDHSVSRHRHAIIIYEPKQRVFIAQSGGSSQLFYLNDKVVLDPVQLHEYDEIGIGDTILMFVPICGPQFSWEEYFVE